MKNHKTIYKQRSRKIGIKSLKRKQKVYEKKVKDARTISHKNSVIKNTIQIPEKYPIVYDNGMGEWKLPKTKKYPTYFKDTFKTKEGKPDIKAYKAYNRQMSNHRGLTHEQLIEGYIENKLAKWEKKNPKPCKDDDLFREEFIPLWEALREVAKEKIIKSVAPHASLTIEARFMRKEGVYENVKLRTIKDRFNEIPTWDVNQKSKLKTKIKKIAKRKAQEDKSFVCLTVMNGDEKILVVPAA